MNRKRKIFLLTALVLAGAGVIAFFVMHNDEPLQVSYLRVSSSGSNRVLFAITNKSDRDLWYRASPIPMTNGVRTRSERMFSESGGMIGPTNATMFSLDVPSSIEWSAAVMHEEFSARFGQPSMREQISRWTESHNWHRVSGWLQPRQWDGITYGPPMLGNKPVAETAK